MITVILNCYKRPQYLQEQIEAIRNQTIPVKDICIWYNKPEDKEQYDITNLGCKVATCNHNFKFHGRFAFGLLAQTEYVAFFDDDTIPGKKWFENCMEYMKQDNYILGSTGVVLESDKYSPNYKIGWNGIKNDKLEDVDLVGHSWFMRRDTLKYLWYEMPVSWDNGEDIQLSALAYLHGGIKTSVPPHPISDISLWGSLPTQGNKYGNDENSSWLLYKNHFPLRDKVCKSFSDRGYKRVLNR